jgi:hypothetical protein
MITSFHLREKFHDLYDPVRLDLDADKNGIYDIDSGKRVASRMLWARYVFRSMENGRANPQRVYKISHHPSDNEVALQELETIYKLQQVGVSGVAKICRLGILEKGGLWIELKGIANARSLNREIFGRVSRFFDVMIRAAEILQAIHAHGVVHGDVKPANILINDQQEIEWIDFEKGMFSEGFSPLDENQQPIIENQGKDTDTFSFIMTLASIMGELMRGSAVSDEMKPMFLKMRDGYLDMIFKRLPQNASYLNSVESLYTSQDAFIQKRRHQWPKKMEIILQKLRSDRELFQSRRR